MWRRAENDDDVQRPAHAAPVPNVYFDPRFGVQAAKILPGEFYVSGQDMVLVTVLGSCVAACIRDTVSGVGGMNHFMLPENASAQDSPCAPSARYGAHAMEMLLNELIKRGARRERLEAKVFGGGAVVPGMQATRVGARNADFVLDYVTRERIALTAADLCDDYPRKVYFFPRSGRVLVRKLRTLHNETILNREAAYVRQLAATRVEGSIELF
jgi:chemotaxis protein CheD